MNTPQVHYTDIHFTSLTSHTTCSTPAQSVRRPYAIDTTVQVRALAPRRAATPSDLGGSCNSGPVVFPATTRAGLPSRGHRVEPCPRACNSPRSLRSLTHTHALRYMSRMHAPSDLLQSADLQSPPFYCILPPSSALLTQTPQV